VSTAEPHDEAFVPAAIDVLNESQIDEVPAARPEEEPRIEA
jgi:hypothetical protein